jgi:hypothetical protein
MARDTDKLELLFRRQVAFEAARAPKRPATYRLDPVSARESETISHNYFARNRHVRNLRCSQPAVSLSPSAGYFNTARIPANAPAWLFVVGRIDRKKMDRFISILVSVQSSKRSFRPIFILEDSEHLEVLRQYGFSFEVICSDAYMGMPRSDQIDCFKRKWGAALCLDLDHLQTAEFAATGFSYPDGVIR